MLAGPAPGAYSGMMNFWQKSPKARLRFRWAIFFLLMLLYAMVRFPDVPLHECASGYCGKGGRPHTATEYFEFLVWQSVLLVGWVIVVCWELVLWGKGEK